MPYFRFQFPHATSPGRYVAGIVIAAAATTISLQLPPATAAEPAQSSPGLAELGIESCRFADPPQIIDGLIASRREMESMGDAIREYATAMQASLACLDGASTLPEHAALIDQLYNSGVDQLNFIVGEYNRQVAMYRRAESVSNLQTN